MLQVGAKGKEEEEEDIARNEMGKIVINYEQAMTVKNVVMKYQKYYSIIHLEGMKNAMKALVKISGKAAKIRIGNPRDSCVALPVYEETCYNILILDSTKSTRMKRY
jgi:hypothetical protein